jgi:Zn-dependent protease with chaperone function
MHRARKLAGISPRAWEHPTDRAALAALRTVRGLDELVRTLVGGTMEKSLRLLHVASAVRVTPDQFRRVWACGARAAEILDCASPPDIFVANSPYFNAGAYGVKEPFIVLSSSLVKGLTDDELYAAVAHELGHILSGHGLYKTLLWLLLRISLGSLPVPGFLVTPLLLALREWDRASELSADRAGLLALQSEKECLELLMKVAGGEELSQMNLNDFFLQAQEYESSRGLLDGLFKLMNTASETHPFPVVRIQELRTWAASGQYAAIIGGDYPRRGDPSPAAADEIREGFDHYRSMVPEAASGAVQAAREAGNAIGKAAEGIREALKDAFKDR